MRRLLGDGLNILRGLVRPIVASVRDNAGLVALSVVLGFALWIFVTDTTDETRSGTLPFDLKVEVVNVPGDLALAESPVNVRVRVDVDENVWDSLTPADFEATVNLEGLQVGAYDAEVRVEPQTGRGGLRVTRVIPPTVEVDLKSLFSKSVPVSASLEGAPPPGFEASIPELGAATVLVTGTQDKVMLVTRAVVKLDLSGRTGDTMQAVRLEPRDSRGFLVEGVSLEPGVINVSVEIEQTEFSRALVISPTVVGTPAAGYDIVSLVSDPLAVTVFGPQSFIAEVATIRTQPIDVTGASDDIVRTVSLDLPAAASVSGGTSVTVTVQIEPARGRQTLGLTVVVVGLEPELSVKGALPLVEVVLLGELPTLQALRPNDITATINLSGLKEGKHQVTVSVSAPAEASVASISPDTVEITLEPR